MKIVSKKILLVNNIIIVDEWKILFRKKSLKICFDVFRRPRGLLTRRLRGRKYDDNELYRSNSFRFQRFERNADGVNGDKQVSENVENVWKYFNKPTIQCP